MFILFDRVKRNSYDVNFYLTEILTITEKPELLQEKNNFLMSSKSSNVADFLQLTSTWYKL